MSSDVIMINEKAKESNEILSQIQGLFSDDKGWDSEEQMLADMAAFRKKRMGL